MQKIYCLLLFVLTLSAAVKAQSGWVTKTLDEKLSVKFPAEPQKVTENGIEFIPIKEASVFSAEIDQSHNNLNLITT
ncbi:MAG: hypothetical protein EOP43_04675 [Sphingobacteriaceae bacterium]|nr:MAG: hypothetical protein EOP43_04675 [Sphingobacteriaceae bacterium]